MFINYYGFRCDPFGVTPDPRFLFPSPGHREALAALLYGIDARRGFFTLIAAPGMGKTTLVYALLDYYRERAETALVFETQCDTDELLRYVAADLGLNPRLDRVTLHHLLRDVLLRAQYAGKTVILVVDEAHNLSEQALETVRLLSNYESRSAKLLQILLSGQEELADRLNSRPLAQLRQRIALSCRLHPFSVADTCDYISHRLQLAGSNRPVFTRAAMEEVARRTDGVPRSINQLCFRALMLGESLDAHVIQRSTVVAAAAEMTSISPLADISPPPLALQR